jgi:TonB family protein
MVRLFGCWSNMTNQAHFDDEPISKSNTQDQRVGRTAQWFAKRSRQMTTLAVESPELKKLWIRVLKRVHPDLAVDELDRSRCERLTQQANDAYARRDEVALRAVLKLNSMPPLEEREHFDHETTDGVYHRSDGVPRRPPTVSRREQIAILCGAGLVLCLLLYGILEALRQEVGKTSSLLFLFLLTGVFLWWISRTAALPDNYRARWASGVTGLMILLGLGLAVRHPNPSSVFSSGQATSGYSLAERAGWKDKANEPPSQWYWDVIKSRVGQSWNPATVVGTPAGSTADISFTIEKDGSPKDIRLRRRSGSPTLDASCFLAVEQVKTFGPPEGGARDHMNIVYPCSYNELAMTPPAAQIAAQPTLPAVIKPTIDRPESGALGDYIVTAKSQVAQNWNSLEVTGTVPAGATTYIQFVIFPRGNHDVPMTETSSGYSSLDSSCLRAVQRIKTFAHLPRGYSNHMTMFYQCTYPGAPKTTSEPAEDRAAESSHDSSALDW